MTRVFDNIDQPLGEGLQTALATAARADIAVGFFNLRGWSVLADVVDGFAGGDDCARVLVGMQQLPQEQLRRALSIDPEAAFVDQRTALRMKREAAQDFRDQLILGLPTERDRASLRTLSKQLRSGKVRVKLHLAHLLHAKLYLAHRPNDPATPIWGFVGSSNLTMAGMRAQGELNVDVTDDKAAEQLAGWFEQRWDHNRSLDISEELADIIDASWAREDLVPPYHLYLKVAYHLSQEARTGLSQFGVPKDMSDVLLPFQSAAVRIAARHVIQRGGVLLGDVVGLGKTLMAIALARVLQDDQIAPATLVICPANLQKMWREYAEDFGLNARIVSLGAVIGELPELKRFPLVIVDESHNLRNREGKRYRVIRDYVLANDARCVLLSATPYNKTYLDLSAQLRLFMADDEDLGLRPERALAAIGETEFVRRHQCGLRTVVAFEHSNDADDWRDLMRLFLVRRTRSFIKSHYAVPDPKTGRPSIEFADGTRFSFPERIAKTVTIPERPDDAYAALYAPEVVDVINSLALPRYGLGNYIVTDADSIATRGDHLVIDNLGRAGRRLMGFSRTNLFKRLESSGDAFLQSVARHVLRNRVVLHALARGLPVPIGTQAPAQWREEDTDIDLELLAEDEDAILDLASAAAAADAYEEFRGKWRHRFKWLPSELFENALASDLENDVAELEGLLKEHLPWRPDQDAKLEALLGLVQRVHPNEKVLVFSQFADTVSYLGRELRRAGVQDVATVDGSSADPTELARRFSPRSNAYGAVRSVNDPIRVLVATDVLSEGQNLQDAAVVVNYDLPWAIVRLVQRAGRVDRIGQQSEEIRCYSFEPAAGVNQIISLRERVTRRLRESGEVLGTDEKFFGDEQAASLVSLYDEKAGVLDDAEDDEVDLASYAYEIWKQATNDDPGLRKAIEDLPAVVYTGKASDSEGSLTYVRTAQGQDALVWASTAGDILSESPLRVLRLAQCSPDEPALVAHAKHLDVVGASVRHVASEERLIGGGLGRPSGARFRAYERLKAYVEANDGTLLVSEELKRSLEDIYRAPLTGPGVDSINRLLRAGASDEQLGELVVNLRTTDRLVVGAADVPDGEPQVLCSVALVSTDDHKEA